MIDMSENEEYLEPEQLRDQLGISEATYYRWLRDGRLKGVKVGRRWRFPKSVLDELREDPERARDRKAGLEQAVEEPSDLASRAQQYTGRADELPKGSS